MSELYIAAEGFTLPSGYVLKELTIIFPSREYKHFMFKKPDHFYPSPKDLKTIRYASQHFNQLSFTEGDIPYNLISNILTPYKEYTMYTYSDIFVTFLKRRLPTTSVINIQTFGYKLPKTLPKPNCFRNHTARYCSLAKAKQILKILENDISLYKTPL